MTDVQIKQFDDIKRRWVGKYLRAENDTEFAPKHGITIIIIRDIGIEDDEGVLSVDIKYSECNRPDITYHHPVKFYSLSDFEEYLAYFFSQFEHFNIELDVVNGFDCVEMCATISDQNRISAVPAGSRIRYINVEDIKFPTEDDNWVTITENVKEYYFVYNNVLCECDADNFLDYCVGVDDDECSWKRL